MKLIPKIVKKKMKKISIIEYNFANLRISREQNFANGNIKRFQIS